LYVVALYQKASPEDEQYVRLSEEVFVSGLDEEGVIKGWGGGQGQEGGSHMYRL
jgi:hypothetical protein